MKVLAVSITVLMLFTFLAFRSFERKAAYIQPRDFPITMCGSAFQADLLMNAPVALIDGLGDLHHKISTNDSLAQKYFDQGLRLVYGFNHVEALRAFKEAARLDPSSAMTWWGQALTLGPNINDWNPKDREAMALEAITRAKELAIRSSQKEKDFILAMAVRYDGKPHDNRDQLNFAYRDAMEKLSKKYPQDAEALVLYADAIMTSMPWDYWNKDGSPKNQTPSARAALELAIKKFPRHPGAHHMYIHLVEASSKPGDAYRSAEFLETAMPSAGHIVHMPSHIYARVGEYQRSNNSNRMAIKADEVFLSRSDDQGMYRSGYYPHNIDFLYFGALMTGESSVAMSEGNKLSFHVKGLQNTVPAYYDYYTPAPIIAMVRYGKWNDILSLPLPDEKYYITAATHHFARGLAFLRISRVGNAEAELSALEAIDKLDTLKTIYAFFNSNNQITDVATKLLKGEVLIAQKKTTEGLRQLEAAVAAEDNLRYNEPSDWRLPARHFLGAALLDAGKKDEAIKVYDRDLAINPENGWSLKGLVNCGVDVSKRFDNAWSKADIVISSSRF